MTYEIIDASNIFEEKKCCGRGRPRSEMVIAVIKLGIGEGFYVSKDMTKGQKISVYNHGRNNGKKFTIFKHDDKYLVKRIS